MDGFTVLLYWPLKWPHQPSQALKRAQNHQKAAYDKGWQPLCFVEGDPIMIKDLSGRHGMGSKLKPPFKGPYHIILIKGQNCKCLPIGGGPSETVHVSRLKPVRTDHRHWQVPSPSTSAMVNQCGIRLNWGAISPSNIGYRMLRHLGWCPGTGLGPRLTGIRSPITITLFPRHLGLGYRLH